MDMRDGMRPIHPGEFLREEFLVPYELTASELARQLKVPVNRISLIVQEKRALTADTALRLARYFGTTPEFWLDWQMSFDIRTAEQASGKLIKSEVPVRKAVKREALRKAG